MAFPITAISHGPTDFDDGGVDRRIGLLALSTDIATERDFHRMLPAGVMFHTARVPQVNPVTPENLRRMQPLLADAVATIAEGQPLDVVAYSCTSASVVLGHDAVVENIRRGRPGVAVVTPISAALQAFEALGVRRISLITPYLESVTQPMAEYLQAQGYSLASVASFGIPDDITMARLSPSAISAAARHHCAADADALFISCTAIRAAETVAALEEELGKPVLTSIQCLFWAALRAAGCRDVLSGHGRLFQVV